MTPADLIVIAEQCKRRLDSTLVKDRAPWAYRMCAFWFLGDVIDECRAIANAEVSTITNQTLGRVSLLSDALSELAGELDVPMVPRELGAIVVEQWPEPDGDPTDDAIESRADLG